MQVVRDARLGAGIMLLTLMVGAATRAADNASNPPITIGGVIYLDVHDPIRTGLQGVAVQVQGDQGHFEAVTAGILGLWKMDVPPGSYTVTPAKSGYSMEHLVRGWCDGQRFITIEVNPKNLAANQSIQFLAVYWPEPNAPTATTQELVEGVPPARCRDARFCVSTRSPAAARAAVVRLLPDAGGNAGALLPLCRLRRRPADHLTHPITPPLTHLCSTNQPKLSPSKQDKLRGVSNSLPSRGTPDPHSRHATFGPQAPPFAPVMIVQ